MLWVKKKSSLRGNFPYKNVTWHGQSRQISALTSVEMLPEWQSSCRLNLSGIISVWYPVDEYSWCLLIVIAVFLGKDHNLFFPPQSLFFAAGYVALPEQLHLQTTGFSQINIVLNPLGVNVLYSCGLFVSSVWAAQSKNVGSWTMVCNLLMLCGVSEIKTQPNRSQERFFKMRKRGIPPTFLPNKMFNHLFQLGLVLFLKPHKEANIVFHGVSYMVVQSGKGKVELRELEKGKQRGRKEEQKLKK